MRSGILYSHIDIEDELIAISFVIMKMSVIIQIFHVISTQPQSDNE